MDDVKLELTELRRDIKEKVISEMKTQLQDAQRRIDLAEIYNERNWRKVKQVQRKKQHKESSKKDQKVVDIKDRQRIANKYVTELPEEKKKQWNITDILENYNLNTFQK